MKKLLASIIAAVVLSGCATGPDKAALKAREDALAKISKVEIFYNGKDELVVIDGGGSSMTGMAGLFGPVGMLVALGADAASKLTLAERAEARSKEFTEMIGQGDSAQTLNRQFAEELANRIRAGGREVKTTPIQRKGGDLAISKMPDAQLTPGYAPLFLRITTAYGAKDALSSYRPVIVIDHALKQHDGETSVYQNTFSARDGEPTYMAYATLLSQSKEAHDGLRRGLLDAADKVYTSVFIPAQ